MRVRFDFLYVMWVFCETNLQSSLVFIYAELSLLSMSTGLKIKKSDI